MKRYLLGGTLLLLLCLNTNIYTQSLKQTIRGKIADLDSKEPLIGVALYIEGSEPRIAAISGTDGSFEFPSLIVGRYNVVVSYVGYEQKIIPNVLLGAGKEANLSIELSENVKELQEVKVKARKNKGEPLNEMASVSARSVSVEETQRFAGSFNDPSRMVSSYAGVTGSPDGDNDIVIRGNSPRGLLWRIEGVDVTNPNHFANEGATGGPISILNSSTLNNSDFFTGAFPAEYGNAYSGVFDVHLRKGNDRKPEYSAQIGIIGTDLTAEGPFSKNSQASYLVNYRYSSLDLLNAIGIKIVGDAVPKFQDMTFNINVPTKKFGTFQLFGIGGLSNIFFKEIDFSQSYNANMGVVGLNHTLLIGNDTYIKSSLSYSGTSNFWEYKEPEGEPETWVLYGKENLKYSTYRMAFEVSHKFSAMHTIKAGVSTSVMNYNLYMDMWDDEADVLFNALNDNGGSELIQAFVNWKFRPFDKLTFNSGIHYQYLALNGNYSFEPRIGARWQLNDRQSVSAGFGMHSKMDNISLYLFKDRQDDGTLIQNNKNIDFIRAYHYIVGYENRLAPNLNFKLEVYYQDLYNVPVADESNNSFSLLNEDDGYITGRMINKGKGTNYGIEMGLDKFFAKNYYFLVTGSLFESKFTDFDGKERNARFNSNYITSLAGGKEIPVGKKKNSSINLNVRGSYAGGQYYTPIDIEESRRIGDTRRDEAQAYLKRRPDYYRFDVKVSFRRNKGKTTRVWELDIENVTNNLNVAGDYWDDNKQEVVEYTQMGLLPNISYRIEF
jgi:hypothetical protein